jgi:hypothetical protein
VGVLSGFLPPFLGFTTLGCAPFSPESIRKRFPDFEKRNLIIAKESKDVIPIEVSKELEEMGIHMFSSVNGASLNTIKMIMARFVSIYLACRYAGETYLMFTNDGRQMIKLLVCMIVAF